MVTDIPKVEPFTFQASTAFDERVQLADKLNEVIDALNHVGGIPDIQTEINGLKQSVASLQESIDSTDANLATVEGNLNKTISDLNALTAKVGTMETTISGIQADITAIEGDISGLDTEVEGLKREVVDEVSMASTTHGSVQVTIHHEDGTQDTSTPIDLALVQEGGITLQTGATDRSFSLRVTLSDGSSWETNDFVIPAGGGTDVSMTSIQISQGTSANQIRVKIGLSDGSFINSNDWTVVTPAEFGTLQTSVQGNTGDITSLKGRTSALETQMGTVDTEISGLDDRVSALEDSPGYSLPVATASVLGGVKIGGNITVQADGTISIPNATTSKAGVMTAAQVGQLNTAAVGSTVMFTGDASKVTLHVDSVAGTAFTEDIPAAADGEAGTIDQAKYQQIATNQNNITALQNQVSTLESEVEGLAPSVSVNEKVTPPTITIGVNGKEATANLPTGGGGGKETVYSFGNLSEYNSVMNAIPEGTEFEINLYCRGRFSASGSSSDTSIAYSGIRITSPNSVIVGSGGGFIRLNNNDREAVLTYASYSETNRDVDFWYLYNNDSMIVSGNIKISEFKEISTLQGAVKY